VSRRFGDGSRTVLPSRRLAVSLAIALALLSTLILQLSTFAQGTSFTYQGRLSDGGTPATGTYDLRFAIYDAVTAGNLVSSALALEDIGVTNGLFSVALDFGPVVFTGANRWLEIAVRPGAQTGAYSVLSPRQSITASPYALYAPNAGMAATVTSVPLSALPTSVPRLDTNSQMSITGDFSLVAPTPLLAEGFEGATFPPAGWATGGNTAWVRTTSVFTEGAAAAASGTIGDNETSYLQLSCNAPASALIKFDWKVESELNYDFLQVFVDGVPMSGISGSVNWTPVALPVSAGAHTIRWAYAKDVNTAAGQDRGWLDNVRLVIATGTLTTEALSVSGQLTVGGRTYFATNVGIGTLNPIRPLQIGDAGVYGSQGLLRMAARSTNSAEYRIWDIGVPQTGTDVTGAGYSFIIDDTQIGTGPEFIVHWGNGRVGIGRTNPVSALDVNGTVTAGSFAGNGGGLTNLNAAQISGTLPIGSLLPSGTMLVSTQPNDPALVTNGLSPMMSVPAPAWVNGATSSAPSARSGHTALWDGQRLIVWGGTVGTGFSVNSGDMYYPADDLWDSVSSLEAPSARVNHTAVWTGSEMIVWGGGGAGGFLNTGGRFQPSPQGWRTVTTNTSPAERSGHIAVWTGSRMFIWGGVNAAGLLNDGALYNPVSNQWTTLALPGAPAARRGATAVWAGDRVLIWGGEGTNGVLNSGASLTFSTGTTPLQWLPMNLANSPAARRWHSAVWTGQKMIVWGGENAGVPLGDGAAFEPLANAWETLSSSGAPVARFNHAAVWTGQEMLILAGTTSSTELTSGAAYDPAIGRWRTLSSAGNPLARTEATAAWTGTEVLIFGGEAQGQCVASLQRLVPQPVWYLYRKL
jgi:hypothetical protein